MVAARHSAATPAEVPSILGLYVSFAIGVAARDPGPRRCDAVAAVDQARSPRGPYGPGAADRGFAGRPPEWTAQLLGRGLEILAGLRDQSGPLRDDDQLGDDGNHGSPSRPWRTGNPTGPTIALSH